MWLCSLSHVLSATLTSPKVILILRHIPLIKTSVHFSVLQRVINIRIHIMLIWNKTKKQTFKFIYKKCKLLWHRKWFSSSLFTFHSYCWCTIGIMSWWEICLILKLELMKQIINKNYMSQSMTECYSKFNNRKSRRTQWMGHPPSTGGKSSASRF